MILIGYKHTPWVLAAQGLTPSEKIVLMCLALHANNETRKTWVSTGTIAKECGYSDGSRRTVRRTLQALRSKGFISYVDQGAGKGRQQKSNTYIVNWHLAPDYKEGGQETPGSGDLRVKKPRVEGQETPGGGSHSPTNEELNEEPNGECFTSEQSSEEKAIPATPKIGRHPNAGVNDPVSPTFYESEDRLILIETVQKFASWSSKGYDTTKLLELLEQDLSVTFPHADLPGPNALGKVWTPPKKCSRKDYAAIWLNQFLHSWKTELGELTWRGNQ